MADEATSASAQNLKEAYRNLTELVSYLSSQGNLPEKIATSEFFANLEAARSGTLKPDQETAFWHSYSVLAQHAKPTQVEALHFRNYILVGRSSEDEHYKKYESNLSEIRNIRVYSILSFICTLLLLSYVSITAGYLINNQSLIQEKRLIDAGELSGTRIANIAEQARSNPIADGNEAGSEDSDDTSGAEPIEAENSRSERIDDIRFETSLEIDSQLEYNLQAMQWFQAYTASSARGGIKQTEGIRHRSKIEAHQRLINLVISSYFLPVFTALLGVTVFILRRTSSSLNSGQYRMYESGTYSYRLTLGVVGGIVISWFTTTDASGVVSSLTPAALAFVVGYSIEVLYNLLDSIVKALGASDAEREAK